MKCSELIKKHCPEITKKIAENKSKPTTEQRISALESAITDLAIMMATGGSTDV